MLLQQILGSELAVLKRCGNTAIYHHRCANSFARSSKGHLYIALLSRLRKALRITHGHIYTDYVNATSALMDDEVDDATSLMKSDDHFGTIMGNQVNVDYGR